MTTEKEEQYGVKPPRVAVFIDGSNLYHSLEENCRRFDLDFRAFAEKLCRGRPLFRVYYRSGSGNLNRGISGIAA